MRNLPSAVGAVLYSCGREGTNKRKAWDKMAKEQKKDVYIFEPKGGYYMGAKMVHNHYMKLPGFNYAALAVYVHILSSVQNQSGIDGTGNPNGLQGWSYKSKETVKRELQIGGSTLNKALQTLERYELIEGRKAKNPYGGKPLTFYRPIQLPTVDEFREKYRHILPKEDKDLAAIECID